MPEFQYTAREATGHQVNGVLTAGTQQEALSALSARQLFPINVVLAESAKVQQRNVSRRVASKHLAVFYSQLADLLKSGVPLLRSLALLQRQTQNPALKAVLQDVHDQVADGSRLFDAMKQHPKCFTELMVSMVRAGEEGGFLEDVLKRISIFTEHQEEMKGRVIGAMVYPIFLVVVGGGIVAILLTWFVPKFEPMFESMREQGGLPWATTTLLGMSGWAKTYWWLALGGIGGIVFGFQYWINTPPGRLALDTFRLKAFGLGRIVRSLAIARFCRVLGTLMKNGVPVLQALRISKDATANIVLATSIDKAADNVSTGKSLAKPLGASKQFPEEIVEMIAVGEESNNLENVLIDVADNLERRTSREVEMAVRLLEPVLLLVMAAIVLFVVVALLLPILNSSQAI